MEKNNDKHKQNTITITNNKDYNDYINSNSKKLYTNIKNALVTSKANEYKSIKNIIINLIEQSFSSTASSTITNTNNNTINNKDPIEFDHIFLTVITQLCNENIINNLLIPKLIQRKDIKTIHDLDNLFSFSINRTSPPNINNSNSNNKTIKAIKASSSSIEKFTINPNAENDYKELLNNHMSICEHVKQTTIQILNSLSFSNTKIPTSPIKFKHFIHSFIQNQKFMRIVTNVLHLDYEKVLMIITEGIIVDFVKLGVVSFPSETKIQYYLQVIELEKFRLME